MQRNVSSFTMNLFIFFFIFDIKINTFVIKDSASDFYL